MSDQHYYFSYGSNCADRKMSKLEVKPLGCLPAVLEHYRLRTNKVSKKDKGVGFCNIEPCYGSDVIGLLYTIEEEDFLKIDRYEGFPVHYEKTVVPVWVPGLERTNVLAATYIATRPWTVRKDLPITEKYKALLVEGVGAIPEQWTLMGYDVNNSDEYFKRINEIKTV